MAEKWFIGHSRPQVMGATSWYGAYHTKEEAMADKDAVAEHWWQRHHQVGYTFVERDDEADLDYGEVMLLAADRPEIGN